MKYVVVLFFFGIFTSGFSQCVSGDCENGYGKYECDCGYVYEGEFKDGQKVKGTLTKKDLVYTGEFKDELAEGFGVMKYKNGSWYEGTFKGNVPDGYGNYYFANGQQYIGEIVDGSFHGLGIQLSKGEGGRLVETRMGNFSNDQLNGIGCSVSYNGDVYMGEFSDGKFGGFGMFVFADGKYAEVGEFHKMKIRNNEVLNDYPKAGWFGIKGYSVDNMMFNAIGDIDATNLTINASDTANQRMYIHYDGELKLFYISKLGSPNNGKAIDSQGQIFDASFDEKAERKITLGKALYKREE